MASRLPQVLTLFRRTVPVKRVRNLRLIPLRAITASFMRSCPILSDNCEPNFSREGSCGKLTEADWWPNPPLSILSLFQRALSRSDRSLPSRGRQELASIRWMRGRRPFSPRVGKPLPRLSTVAHASRLRANGECGGSASNLPAIRFAAHCTVGPAMCWRRAAWRLKGTWATSPHK